MPRTCIVASLLCLLAPRSSARGGDVSSNVARIKAVGREGAGNVEAARAWKELVKDGPDALVDVLTGLDGASPAAANWLRTAVDAVAERTLAAGKPLPAGRLEAFVRDTRQNGAARRLAYEWLVRADATAPERLLPGMLNDPGAELRRDAVAVVLKDAQRLFDKDDKPGAVAAYKKALDAARDRDQLLLCAERLKKLGVETDLTAHFGFITRWMTVGPFDNAGGVGFSTVFPPERGVDLKATYRSKDGKQIRWQEHVTTLPFGLVDINKIGSPLHGATYFGFTAVSSPAQRPVEVRAGSNNAVRIFVNGKEVYFREEYHHGMEMDQHVGRAVLKAGRNEVLIKVCQNEQTDSWAQQWSFQLRICDAIGGAVPLTVLNEGSK
jgi:hypothetical protein